MAKSAVTSIPTSIIESYSLASSDGDSGDGRPKLSAFILRLTDASLKSLNESAAELRRGESKSQIGFIELAPGGNDGRLSFVGSQGTEHHFSMFDAQRDLGPTGHLEAVAQTKASTKNAQDFGRMLSVGAVTKRLHISATTKDTFESTKKKTKQVNEDMRKNTAKVLKGPGGGGMSTNKKFWNKVTKATASTSQRPLTPLSHLQRSSSPRVNGGKIGTPSTTTKIQAGDASIEKDVTKQPLRQRILYQLLILPSTPSDLLAKLSEKGLTDQERQIFELVFRDVGQIRPGGGGATTPAIYEVKRALLSELNPDDWPFYSPWERQIANRILVTTLSKSLPNAHASDKDSADETDDGTQRVKKRITYKPPAKRQMAGKVSDLFQKPRSSSISPRTAAAIDGVSAVTITNEDPPPHKKLALDGTNHANLNGQRLSNVEEETLQSFEAEYPPIQTTEERQRYKEEFDKDYPIYMELYDRLRSTVLKFEEIGAQLKSMPKGTPNRIQLEKDMVCMFANFESNPEVKDTKRRHELLKQKLHVIKMRVKDFDSRLAK